MKKLFSRIGLIACLMIAWASMPSFALPDEPDSFVAQTVLDANSAQLQADLAVSVKPVSAELTDKVIYAESEAALVDSVTDKVGVSRLIKGVSGARDVSTLTTASDVETGKTMVQITYRNCADLT